MPDTIAFKLNGQRVSLKLDADRGLPGWLHTDLALTGSKYSCGRGGCGTCTVLVNDRPVR